MLVLDANLLVKDVILFEVMISTVFFSLLSSTVPAFKIV